MLRRAFQAHAFVVFCLLLACPLLISQTRADELFANCSWGRESKQVRCDLRFSDPLTRPRVESASVRWVATNTTDPATFSAFNPAQESVAWLILVDRTKSMTVGEPKGDTTRKAIIDDVMRIINGSQRHHLIGLATFADKIDMLAPIGSSKNGLVEAANKIKLDGTSTALYHRALGGIEELRSFPGAKRKALLILSDGRSEDPEADYYKKKVTDAARDSGIGIFAVHYPTAKDPLGMQALSRLADEGRGRSETVDPTTRRAPVAFLDSLFDYMETGGTATFPLRANPDSTLPEFVITTNLGGRQLSRRMKLDEPVQMSGWWERIAYWWSSQPTIWQAGYAGGGVLLLGLAGFLGIWKLRRRRRRSDDPITQDSMPHDGATMDASGTWHSAPATELSASAFGPTRILTDASGHGNGPAYAWLERVGTADRIPITETSVRIGRHEDNDLKFNEESVHRRHAVVHMTPQREFIITDLSGNGGNGVVVNSQRVEKKSLRDGDVIKLGEVQLRFQVATV